SRRRRGSRRRTTSRGTTSTLSSSGTTGRGSSTSSRTSAKSYICHAPRTSRLPRSRVTWSGRTRTVERSRVGGGTRRYTESSVLPASTWGRLVRQRKDGWAVKVTKANAKNYVRDRKSTRLNSSHVSISYAVFC